MSQGRYRVSAVCSLVAGVEQIECDGIHGPQAVFIDEISIDKPQDAVGIPVGRNDGVTSAFHLHGLDGGWNDQLTVAKVVSTDRLIFWGEIYGVVPINGDAAKMGSQR